MIFGSWLTRPHERSARAARALALADVRFCVVDVSVTGTDRSADRVEGIACLPVIGGRFAVADIRFCRMSSKDVRGCIDEREYSAGYKTLLDDTAGAVLVTHNARFVRAMLERYGERNDVPLPARDWLEITDILDNRSDKEVAVTTMSHWAEQMQNGPQGSHDAIYDVFVLAQMLLAVLAYAEQSGAETLEAILRNREARTWLRG